MAVAIMVQGTGSDVGKSWLCLALCRLLAQQGWRVAPFKSQNMGSAVFQTVQGEMASPQMLQALAAGVTPSVHMNPILLIPEAGGRSQVIVQGDRLGKMTWQEYGKRKNELFTRAMHSYATLAAEHDVIVIEGAGSPAEVNLRDEDIVNMRVAAATDAPVLLVTDIDRGGSLAWVVGTLELLLPHERERVKGIVFNKFRGDVNILRPGLTFLEQRCRVPIVGVLPYVTELQVGPGQPMEQLMRAIDAAAHAVKPNLDLDAVYKMMGLVT